MGVSTLTLAKRIKQTIQNHPQLVERDGTGGYPQAYNFNFSGELKEAADTLRMHTRTVVSIALNALQGNAANNVPAADDTSREAAKKRNTLYAVRALHSLSNSPNSIIRTTFQTRSFGADAIEEITGYSETECQPLDGLSAIFQFKRHATDENNPWLYSWLLVVEGVAISRGSAQHYSKMISALLKQVDLNIEGNSAVQSSIAELVKLKGTNTNYYWYLSNQYTAMYYHAFLQYKSLTSCMSKEASWYNHTGRGQHPMDCYDNSPDWSLMFISKQSPEEIIEMCDLVIANPDDADSLFQFPFLTRCMVLPTDKETSDNTFETPYVMGKFYGEDKLVRFFYDDNQTAPYHKNNNGLLSGSYYIDGGRIPAITTTKEGEETRDVLLLPYFDKNNKARLIHEDGESWWVSLGQDWEKYRDPIAKCAYEYGSARFEYLWSPHEKGFVSVSTYRPETFNTIFGIELEKYRRYYSAHTINGTDTLVPDSYFTTIEGNRVMLGEVSRLYDGTDVITAHIVTYPERYQAIPGLGVFDLENPTHLAAFNQISQGE